MSDYPNERDCEHGHLRRQCPICELEAENKELRSRLRNVEDQNRHMRAWIRELRDTQEDRGHEPADPLYSMLLERIEQLMQADPAADSIDGARLLELVGLCEAYETRQGQRALGVDAENKALQSRLSDCESALRSLDVGRESSYWVVERRCHNVPCALDVGHAGPCSSFRPLD